MNFHFLLLHLILLFCFYFLQCQLLKLVGVIGVQGVQDEFIDPPQNVQQINVVQYNEKRKSLFQQMKKEEGLELVMRLNEVQLTNPV